MTKIQIQLASNGTQQTDAGRCRRWGKCFKEIDTFTLPATPRYHPRLSPGRKINLIRIPTVHPLRRNNIQAVWLLNRTESTRVLRATIFFLHGLEPKIGIFVGERFRVRARRQKLTQRARGEGGFS